MSWLYKIVPREILKEISIFFYTDTEWLYEKITMVILKKIEMNPNDLELVDFLRTILFYMEHNESDLKAASMALQSNPKFRMAAIEIMAMCKDVHEKCEQQRKGLHIGLKAIEKFGCTRKEAWTQIQKYMK